MTIDSERLTQALGERYRLERELGRGGMATVYRAHDLKHDRPVALKVMNGELVAVTGRQRFLHEITLTARLNHPHILPLLDSGESNGVLYYVMPLVAGESLRDRLVREKQLPLESALQIAREIADALSYAHNHGVIHRDVKPENILLDAGHAVVADFGIARAITVVGGEKFTATGLALGTPAYMSPEQAAGEADASGRSDIYSLGCVLYEMLAGAPPFTGPTAPAVLARHALDPVPPLTTVRKAVPLHVERAVLQALEKVPADRFATAEQFAEALQGHVVPRHRAARARRWRPANAVLVGAGVALIAAIAMLGPWSRSRSTPPAHPLSSLAVLPFTNQTRDSTLDYFVMGMHKGVVRQLRNVDALTVKASAADSWYRDSRKRLEEIADDFGVGALVEAKVTLSADSVWLDVRLVQAKPKRELWNVRFAGAEADVYRLYDEIADSVAAHVLPPGAARRRLVRRRPFPKNLEAYKAFLRGEYANGTDGRSLVGDKKRAIAHFQQAVKLDPDFAEAHARLAMGYAAVALNEAAPDRAELTSSVRSEATIALALDSTASLGYLGLARYRQLVSSDLNLAFLYLNRAQQLDPRSDEALVEELELRVQRCDYGPGVDLGKRALRLNPFNDKAALGTARGHWGRAKAKFMARVDDPARISIAEAYAERDSAELYFDRTIRLTPTREEHYVLLAYWQMAMRGDVAAASRALQQAVLKVGPERTVAAFFRTLSVGSRVLARDTAYRNLLEQAALGSPHFDSTDYYAHKAMLYDGVGEVPRARVYWDSVRLVTDQKAERSILRRWDLALAYAALGHFESANALAQQVQDDAATQTSCYSPLYHIALLEMAAGREDSAITLLSRVALHEPVSYVTPKFLSLDPGLRSLRANRRFQKLIGEY